MTPGISRSSRVALCLLAVLVLIAAAFTARAQTPTTTCDAAGIGSAQLAADGPRVSILSASRETAGSVSYCLVKVLVPQAINIWVGLPLDGAWNARWQSVGGSGYAGAAVAPAQAVGAGFAAATTDTGHSGFGGNFGMLEPGKPNEPLQIDFAYRSEHLMAVIGKQLVEAFYGRSPQYSYWNGCSTGGRQGLRMAQDYPDDYDGILAGAPAIHWDRFQAGHIWYQMVQLRDNGGPIGGGTRDVLVAKQKLATSRALTMCDADDGVADGVPHAARIAVPSSAPTSPSTCRPPSTRTTPPTTTVSTSALPATRTSCAGSAPAVRGVSVRTATRSAGAPGSRRPPVRSPRLV
jgi:hypothetical protein